MRFNVLHLIADDLRTSIGAYGHTDAAKTPHLDRLAARGVVFENAYRAEVGSSAGAADFGASGAAARRGRAVGRGRARCH